MTLRGTVCVDSTGGWGGPPCASPTCAAPCRAWAAVRAAWDALGGAAWPATCRWSHAGSQAGHATLHVSFTVFRIFIRIHFALVSGSGSGSPLSIRLKKLIDFPVPSRDVTNQTLPGQKLLNYSRSKRVWSVTSRLGTGKQEPFFKFFLQCSVFRITGPDVLKKA